MKLLNKNLEISGSGMLDDFIQSVHLKEKNLSLTSLQVLMCLHYSNVRRFSPLFTDASS